MHVDKWQGGDRKLSKIMLHSLILFDEAGENLAKSKGSENKESGFNTALLLKTMKKEPENSNATE